MGICPCAFAGKDAQFFGLRTGAGGGRETEWGEAVDSSWVFGKWGQSKNCVTGARDVRDGHPASRFRVYGATSGSDN